MSKLRLRYLTGPRRGQELSFPPPRVRIGRSRDNDLVLTEGALPLTSAHHAEARFERGAWWIVDLGSTNHTFVNDSPVTSAPLHSGDRVGLGTEVFDVRVDARAVHWALPALVLMVVVALASAYALRVHEPGFEEIAARAAGSVYLVATESGGDRTVTGTAFGVDAARALLATNAHVANELNRRIGQGARAVVVRSDDYQAAPVSRIWIHPQWRRGSLDHDVALLQVGGGAHVVPLPLGDAAAVERLRRGASLASFGFPAVGTDPRRPRGRLAVDVVGDVRLPFVEVGLAISPGTSGSPVFDETGTVVGIVVGGDFVAAPDGRSRRPSGSAVNWVIVATSLRELLDAAPAPASR